MLLYRRSDNFLSEPQFCGFIPIPDEVRQHMRRTTSEPSQIESDGSSERVPPPAKPQSGDE